jgi:hypothetical protein
MPEERTGVEVAFTGEERLQIYAVEVLMRTQR